MNIGNELGTRLSDSEPVSITPLAHRAYGT